jgi:hypothetical protein
MSWKIIVRIGVLACAGLIAGCDPSSEMLLKAATAEANTLKGFCEQNNFKAPEISRADSLMALASVKLQSGKKEEMFSALDFAIINYRLALSKLELSKTEKITETARRQLSDDEDELNTYQKVLAEMTGETK